VPVTESDTEKAPECVTFWQPEPPSNDLEKIFNKFPKNDKKPLALKKDYE
jgi:hypothetical protein